MLLERQEIEGGVRTRPHTHARTRYVRTMHFPQLLRFSRYLLCVDFRFTCNSCLPWMLTQCLVCSLLRSFYSNALQVPFAPTSQLIAVF